MVYIQIGVAVIALGYFVYKTWYLFPLRIERGRNSDDFTASAFIDLVGKARGVMLVCDDGNEMSGSIYDSPEVVAAVKSKLDSDPQFGMRCMFSSNFKTKFRLQFDCADYADRIKFATVEVRRTIHFKIINDGREAYVSEHLEGERERRYTIYRNLIGPARTQVLGSYMDDINRVFADAA